MTMVDDTPLWHLDTCDKNTILFVGRFDVRKGADIVLKAFRLILKAFPSAKLIFVGPDVGLPGANGRTNSIRIPIAIRSSRRNFETVSISAYVSQIRRWRSCERRRW